MMPRVRTGSARARRFRAAEARRGARARAELENQGKGMQSELNAIVEYLRAHESRIASCERRLSQHSGEFDWLRAVLRKALQSRFWNAIGGMSQFTRKIVQVRR